MARKFDKKTLQVLEVLKTTQKSLSSAKLYKEIGGKDYKSFYNLLFRLAELGLAEKNKNSSGLEIKITPEGEKLLGRHMPKTDGVWKLVIFDIPEKHKYVRQVLRAKLKSLHFKKWQNSIWISPYALDQEIEDELKALAKKFFVRLIKTTNINETEDLEKLFS